MSEKRRRRDVASGSPSKNSPKKQRNNLGSSEKLEIYELYCSFIAGRSKQAERHRRGKYSHPTHGNSMFFKEAYELLPLKFRGLGFSTYKKIIKTGKQNPEGALFRAAGRPTTLSEEEERDLVNIIREATADGFLVTHNCLVIWGFQILTQSPRFPIMDETSKEEAVQHIGGKKWLRSFKARHDIQIHSNERSLEAVRAQKTQPENTVDFFRNLLRAHALSHIHREARTSHAMNDSLLFEGLSLGTNVELPQMKGFPSTEEMKSKIRSIPGKASWQPGVSDLDGDFLFADILSLDECADYFHKRLNKPLEPLCSKFVWNLDEKPLIPDISKGVSITVEGRKTQSATGIKTSSWTLLMWTSAYGENLSPLVIFPDTLKGQSGEISAELVYEKLRNPSPQTIEPRISWEPNGWMNKKLFENELATVLPKLRSEMPPNEMGILTYDAHKTHISRKAIQIAKFYGFIILTLPSHLSILLQPLDNYFNAAYAKAYREQYQTTWKSCPNPNSAQKFSCILTAFRQVQNNQAQSSQAWCRCGMDSGFPTPTLISLNRYAVGIAERKKNTPLTEVTLPYLRIIFSRLNLCQPPGSLISGEVLQKLQQAGHEDETHAAKVRELLKILADYKPPTIQISQLSLPSSAYFLPRVEKTLAHNRDLFLTFLSQEDSENEQQRFSQAATKAAREKLASLIGRGAILSSVAVMSILEVTEAETKRKKKAQKRRDSFKESQKPIWQELLAVATRILRIPTKDSKLLKEKIDKRGAIPIATLKSWCQVRELYIRGKTRQVELANVLLGHFGSENEISEMNDNDNLDENDENEVDDDNDE